MPCRASPTAPEHACQPYDVPLLADQRANIAECIVGITPRKGGADWPQAAAHDGLPSLSPLCFALPGSTIFPIFTTGTSTLIRGVTGIAVCSVTLAARGGPRASRPSAGTGGSRDRGPPRRAGWARPTNR